MAHSRETGEYDAEEAVDLKLAATQRHQALQAACIVAGIETIGAIKDGYLVGGLRHKHNIILQPQALKFHSRHYLRYLALSSVESELITHL